MNISTIKKALVIIALAIMPISMIAQEQNNVEKPKPANYWFIDVDGGGAMLFGDNKAFQINKTKLQGRIGFGYNFVGCLSAYGKIGYGGLAGDFENVFSGKGNYISYNANFAVDLINLIGGYKEDRVFGLKLHAGVGQVQYRATATMNDGTENRYGYNDCEGNDKGKGFGGRKVAVEVPMGLEFNFNVSRLIDIYADFATSFVDTDKLDGCMRGNHKDWYSTGSVGIRFKLNCNKKEPVVVEEPAPEPVPEPVVVEEPVKEEPVVVKAEPVRTDNNLVVKFNKNTAEIDVVASDKSMQEFVNNLGNARIENIKIIGYASPEGKDDFNKNIAMERANAAKEYIMQRLGDKVNDATFDVTSAGADWDNFMPALKNSNVRDKETIYNKLSNSNNMAGTLWTFKADHPELQELYPALRRAEVIVTTVTE